MDGFPAGSIWPASDDENIQIREVFARFGLAMHEAQVLEHGMINFLFADRVLPTRHKFSSRLEWESFFDEFFEERFSDTFGTLIKKIETECKTSDEILSDLKKSKSYRDRLAHRFFREHSLNFISSQGRTLMISECEQIIGQIKGTDEKLEELTRDKRIRYGITQEWLDEQMKTLIEEAHRKWPNDDNTI